MDSDLRRLERLASTGDRQAELQLAAARDRLALPWSVDPTRDPVRRLLARTPRAKVMSPRRTVPYVFQVALPGAPVRTRQRTACDWRRAPTEFYNPVMHGGGLREVPPERRTRLLHCYERLPIEYSYRTNQIALFAGRHWRPARPFGADRLRAMQRTPLPTVRAWRQRVAIGRHEVACDDGCRTFAANGTGDRCQAGKLLIAEWRGINYNSHRPVPVPANLFPPPYGAYVCRGCAAAENDWPKAVCRS